MTRLTWILYLVGSALVLGSYLGWVSSELAWIGWIVATGIALASWSGVVMRRRARVRVARDKATRGSDFTPEEEEAARREVQGGGL